MATGNNRELTAEDAAKVLKVHSRTIRNMIAKKEIRGKKVGGKWFVDKSSLKKWQTEPKRSNAANPNNRAFNDLRKLAAYSCVSMLLRLLIGFIKTQRFQLTWKNRELKS